MRKMKFKSLIIFFILTIFGSIATSEESQTSNSAWVFNEVVLSPVCFKIPWGSGDNYQEYAEQFKIADDSDFEENPGKYFTKQIPLSPITPSWGDGNQKISIVSNLAVCNSRPQTLTVASGYVEATNHYVEWETAPYKNTWGFKRYSLGKKVSSKECQKLAPHIKGICKESYTVGVLSNSGGSWTQDEYMIYGLFQTEGNHMIIPLKKFSSESEALAFNKELYPDDPKSNSWWIR